MMLLSLEGVCSSGFTFYTAKILKKVKKTKYFNKKNLGRGKNNLIPRKIKKMRFRIAKILIYEIRESFCSHLLHCKDIKNI